MPRMDSQVFILIFFLAVFPYTATAGPLHDAARSGDAALVAELAANEEDMNALDDEGLTPLLQAVLYERPEVVARLIALGSNVDGRSSRGFTALHAAGHKGNLPISAMLIDAGAKIDIRDNLEGVSPLHLAAEGGHAALVELLIAKGADTEATAKDGKNPLTMATLKDRPDVIRILIRHGGDCTKIRLEKFRTTCQEAGN